MEVFATESLADPHFITDRKESIRGLYAPFSKEQIQKAIQDPKASNAAGPDGITAIHLRKIRPIDLAIFFNAMLLSRSFPPALKACRTTLMPKGDADLANISSWRPITVANILVRTLHRLLSSRLTDRLRLHPGQRGFISLDGTMGNSILLQTAIRTCCEKAKPYSIVSLDLRKAFDTVPHTTIRRALDRFSMDSRLAGFIMDDLTGCSTSIKVGPHLIENIPIRRGVKQGDPLSPVLFNLVLDELLCFLDAQQTGIKINGTTINSLAYADDLLLLTPSAREMQLQLRSTERLFDARHMAINPDKCSSLTTKVLPAKKKFYFSELARLYIGPTPLPLVDAESSFKYLRHKYGFMGTTPPPSISLL